MQIRSDVEALLRKLLANGPVKSDGPPDQALPGPHRLLASLRLDRALGDAPRKPRPDPAIDALVAPLLSDLRDWTVAMAWSQRPSRTVLEYVMLATEGRLRDSLGDTVSPASRRRILDLCRHEAWRIIMDIRRAA